MKILLQLESIHFTREQNNFCSDNPIEIEWNLPFLPRVDELFHFDEIVDENIMPEFYKMNLSFYVDCIVYTKIKGVITPLIWLCGQ